MRIWGYLVGVAAGALLLAGSASAVTGVRCGSTIKSPGTYAVNTNCSGAGITIKASHVTLSLKGHTLQGDFDHDGIDAVNVSDVRILGPGTIKNYNQGIFFDDVDSVYVGGLTTKKNGSWGVLALDGSSNVTIEKVTAAVMASPAFSSRTRRTASSRAAR